MSDETRDLTERERGTLILRTFGGIALAFVIQHDVSAHPSRVEALTAVGVSALALVWIYRAVPGGRGSMDFKIGMFVGLACSILCYGICYYGIPALLDAILGL